ncbi:MAG: DUF3027 domain-containing protein [Jiangellaceae bacterium]
MTTAPARPRSKKADDACVKAVELARAAATEPAGRDNVGDHLGHDAEDDRVVTHYFAATARGYRGWRWSVTLTRASRSKVVTVDECVLLPGPNAILAPPWVPWDERVEPEDLGPGDLLPTAADDPRLVPGYTGADEGIDAGDTRTVTEELGLGRPRVLSPEGRDEAAERWLAGTGGPDTEIARAAPLPCATCGFLVPLAGSLGRVFGACANERSPFDGQVVSFDHGCGAHSEVRLGAVAPVVAGPVLDTFVHEVVPHQTDLPDEEFGHS